MTGCHNSWKNSEGKVFVVVVLSAQYAFFITSPPTYSALLLGFVPGSADIQLYITPTSGLIPCSPAPLLSGQDPGPPASAFV